MIDKVDFCRSTASALAYTQLLAHQAAAPACSQSVRESEDDQTVLSATRCSVCT